MHPIHRYLLNYLSPGEFILLLITVVGCISLGILFLVQKYLSSFIHVDHNKYLAIFIGSISANYGFILGFIIVTLWRELEQVRMLVTQESEHLSTIVYSIYAFPQSIQNEMMHGIEQYIQALLQDEWPAMRRGHSSPLAESALTKLYYIIQSYSPDTRVESTFYAQIVSNLNAVSQYRGRRLEYLHTSLVDVIRFMMGFGLFLIIFLISLLENKHKRLQLISIIVVSSMLSFNLGLALLFDYPLAGTISVSPEPFTNGILTQFNAETEKNIPQLNTEIPPN